MTKLARTAKITVESAWLAGLPERDWQVTSERQGIRDYSRLWSPTPSTFAIVSRQISDAEAAFIASALLYRANPVGLAAVIAIYCTVLNTTMHDANEFRKWLQINNESNLLPREAEQSDAQSTNPARLSLIAGDLQLELGYYSISSLPPVLLWWIKYVKYGHFITKRVRPQKLILLSHSWIFHGTKLHSFEN